MQSVEDKSIHKNIHQVMNEHAVPNGIEANGNIAENGTEQGCHQHLRTRFTDVKSGGEQGLNKEYGNDFFGARFGTEPAKLKKATKHAFISEKVEEVGKLVKEKGKPGNTDEFGKWIFSLQRRLG